jgi:predicted enzyme related to lactoylglutathione lyase
MVTTPKLYRIALPVSDIEAAAKFYSHVLATPGKRISPDRHYFDLGGFMLACYVPAADAKWTFDQNQYVYFAVSDLDEIRTRIEQAGGRNLTEIAKMPWGETMFFAVDPSGSRLGFAKNDKLFSI